MKEGQVAIYTLHDPRDRDGAVYVGSAQNPEARRAEHIREASRTPSPKVQWLAAMLKDGVEPEMRILQWVDATSAPQAEVGTIMAFAEKGRVLNDVCGGRPDVRQTEDGTLIRAVKPFAQRSAHITLPKDWIGRDVQVHLLPRKD